MGGPRPAARAADAPQSPMAWVRCSAENAWTTRASDAGTSTAAPSACTIRAATSKPTLGAIAQSSEAPVNTSTPQTKAFLRPSRSASRPHGTRNAANTML